MKYLEGAAPSPHLSLVYPCRDPYSAASSFHSEWSPPWFVTVRGAEWGAVAGAERLSVLVGALSERALHNFTSGPKIALSTDYGICVPAFLSPKSHK